MIDATPALRLYSRFRLGRLASLDPVESQRRTLRRLISKAHSTRFGRDHSFGNHLEDVASYQGQVPLRHYEDFWRDYWKPAFPEVRDVSWPGLIPYFAVTSGTTTGGSKYIPVTREVLRSNAKAGADLYAFHLRANRKSRIMAGRSLMLGGSASLVDEAPGVRSGDLSGITVAEMPWYAKPRYYPPPEIALLDDWEEKIERLAVESPSHDIRMISGTPSWLLLFFERVLAIHGASDLRSIYPKLELLVHGGVSFTPYERRFATLNEGISLMEVYPASEGFIALADEEHASALRLSLDHDLFFEFVPVEELDSPNPTRHWVGNAEPGIDYAVVVTTCAGLWSYVLGDTVTLTEDRLHLHITGRTAQMLSAFGEHVIVAELDDAVAAAAEACASAITDYAVGAVIPEQGTARGHHRVIVEVATGAAPIDARRFSEAFDSHLQGTNDDYRAHRAADFGLDLPRVTVSPPGMFAGWMKSRGKLGGQNKVPRVITDPAQLAGLGDFAESFAKGPDSPPRL